MRLGGSGDAGKAAEILAAEIACRGTGRLLVNDAALDTLQALRERLGKPLICARRIAALSTTGPSVARRRRSTSKGRYGDHDPEAFEAAAREIGFRGFGVYPRSGFMHVDLGPARSWGERFPKRAMAFAAETPPAREVLAESRKP